MIKLDMATIWNDAADTEWPSFTILSEEKKRFLINYFSLLDTSEASAGENIAKLFTSDGCMRSPAGEVHGSKRMFKFVENEAVHPNSPFWDLSKRANVA